VLTSLEPPSPASSAEPREVDPSVQIAPHLPEALPMTSPPELHPEKHRDAAESSRVTLVFKSKRWLQKRFEKPNKNQASRPPDRLSTNSGQPVDRFNSQSQTTANITQSGPSKYAGGKRVRVSVFFFGGQQVCGMSDQVSQRTVGVDLVRCSGCPLARCLSS
jgi:hypothetical protein